MKSRFRSMLLPYILWNLAVIIVCIATLFAHRVLSDPEGRLINEFISSLNWHAIYDFHSGNQDKLNWLGGRLLFTTPILIPLWFLRDLIIVSIFSPAIFFVVKRFRLLAIVILFLCYVSRVWTIIPGFSITAFFYFSLGAYFSIHRINMINWTNKRKNIILTLTILLFTFCILFDGTNSMIGYYIFPFYVCFGVLTLFILIFYLTRKFDWRPNRLLISSCFFIYAIHAFTLPVGNPLTICHELLIANCFNLPFGNLISYMLSPLITIAFCIAVYMLMKRCTPAIARLLSGNR